MIWTIIVYHSFIFFSDKTTFTEIICEGKPNPTERENREIIDSIKNLISAITLIKALIKAKDLMKELNILPVSKDLLARTVNKPINQDESEKQNRKGDSRDNVEQTGFDIDFSVRHFDLQRLGRLINVRFVSVRLVQLDFVGVRRRLTGSVLSVVNYSRNYELN